jgi:hypothetical protein
MTAKEVCHYATQHCDQNRHQLSLSPTAAAAPLRYGSRSRSAVGSTRHCIHLGLNTFEIVGGQAEFADTRSSGHWIKARVDRGQHPDSAAVADGKAPRRPGSRRPDLRSGTREPQDSMAPGLRRAQYLVPVRPVPDR